MTTKCTFLKSMLAGVGIAVCSSALAQAVTHDQLQKALVDARSEAEWPGLTVAEAVKNLTTAEAALAFVRDGIRSADYLGSFHGKEGTLRTRVGNNLDKAILLEALLQAQGYQTELVSAPRGVELPIHSPAGLKRPQPQLGQLKALLAPLVAQLSPMSKETILAEVASSSASLLKEVAIAGALVNKELARHQWKPVKAVASPSASSPFIWVRARKSGEWQSFDPYSDAGKLPAKATRFQATAPQIKLIVYSSDALGKIVGLLQWEGKSHDLAGYDVRLGWLPGDEQVKALKDLTLPLKIKVKQWIPVLQMGAVKSLSDLES